MKQDIIGCCSRQQFVFKLLRGDPKFRQQRRLHRESVWGQQRKSQTTILISAKPPKAEVARRRWHFAYVPLADIRCSATSTAMWHIAMPVEEPSKASNLENHGDRRRELSTAHLRLRVQMTVRVRCRRLGFDGSMENVNLRSKLVE